MTKARSKKKNTSSKNGTKNSNSKLHIGSIGIYLVHGSEFYQRQFHLFSLIWACSKIRLSRYVKTCPLDDLVQCFEEIDWQEKKARTVAISYLMFFIENINIRIVSEMVVAFSPIILKTLIATIDDYHLKLILENLEDNDILSIVKHIPKSLFLRVVNLCPNADQLRTYQNLQYNSDFIGSMMSREFITMKSTMKVGEVLKVIRRKRKEYKNENYIYVVDANNFLQCQLLIRDLFFEKSSTVIAELSHERPIDFSEKDDIEDVLNTFKKFNLIEAPIVNEQRMVGVISYEQIYALSVEEFTEDFQRIAGIEPLKENYLSTSISKIVRSRIVWLFILMISATFSQMVIQSMQSVIGSKFAVLFSAGAGNLVALFAIDSLIPVISGSAGNAGTQSSMTMIRSLALDHIKPHDYTRVFVKELKIAIIIGVLLSVFNFFRMLIYDVIYNSVVTHGRGPVLNNYDWYIMIAFFFAINFTIIVSKIVGASIPLVIHKIGKDPSVMSSPLLTTMIDAICNGATYALCILVFLSFSGFHAQ